MVVGTELYLRALDLVEGVCTCGGQGVLEHPVDPGKEPCSSIWNTTDMKDTMKRIKPIQKCPDCACAAQRFASVNECYVKSSVEFDIRLSFSFGFMKQSRFRKTTLDPAKCHQSTVSESFQLKSRPCCKLMSSH